MPGTAKDRTADGGQADGASPRLAARPGADRAAAVADARPCAKSGVSNEASLREGRPDLLALRERIAAIAGAKLHRLEVPAETPSPGGKRRDEPDRGDGRARIGEAPGRPSAPNARPGEADRPRSVPEPADGTGFAQNLAAEGLTEVHADETRGGGSAAGLVLALASRLGASSRRPLLWISQGFGFHEAGRLYAPGLAAFGFDPGGLVQVETGRLDEAVWVAEEAARSGALACAVLEVRGNPGKLALEGTRRLHVRARAAGVPLFLLRQGAVPEPTAAPLRLRVEGGPALGIPALGPAGERLIGHPVFSVAVEKSRDGRARRLLLEWNPHDRRLQTVEPRPLSVAALPLSSHRSDPAREGARDGAGGGACIVPLRRAG